VCKSALTNWTACEELAIIGAVAARWGSDAVTATPPQADLAEAHMYRLIFELVETNDFLFSLSYADMVLQFLFLPLILMYVCGALIQSNEAIELGHGVANALMLVVDLVLTVLSVVQATSSLAQVQGLIAPNCLDLTTRVGNTAENSLIKAEDSLKKVSLLGWIEAAIALISILTQAAQPCLPQGGKEVISRSVVGVMLIIMVAQDIILSVVNFFAFTTDSKREVDDLFISLIGGSAAWCVVGQCAGGAANSTLTGGRPDAPTPVGLIVGMSTALIIVVAIACYSCCTFRDIESQGSRSGSPGRHTIKV
jgi:hypothetical protein